MFSSKDTDDDNVKQKQILGAIDDTLLTSGIFQTIASKTTKLAIEQQINNVTVKKIIEATKSQRYLPDPMHTDNLSKLHISDNVQICVWRKLSAIIKQQLEFYQIDEKAINIAKQERKREKYKGKLKLLNNANCYLHNCAYEDYIEEYKRPQKKFTIKRRQLEVPTKIDYKRALKSIVVSGEYILSGSDTHTWAPRKMRNIFYFKADQNGVLQPV